MASSRASTPAARRRQQAQSARVRGQKAPQRAKPKPKSPAKPKPKAQKQKTPAKPKPKPKPKVKAKAKARAAEAERRRRLPRPSSRAPSPWPRSWPSSHLGLAAAYFFWFRDSSFVLVEKVTVEGMEGPEAEAVTAALTRAGSEMTTLNVDEEELATAVSRYPTVVSVDADADLPARPHRRTSNRGRRW